MVEAQDEHEDRLCLVGSANGMVRVEVDVAGWEDRSVWE